MSIDHGQIVSCDDEFRCGVAPMVDAHTTPVFEEEFVFTEDLFKQYYLLHLRPHDRSLGLKLLGAAGCLFIVWAILAIPYYAMLPKDPSISIFTDPATWTDYQHLAARAQLIAFAFLFVGFFDVFYGIWHLRGRHPNWNKTSWRIRLDQSFNAIKAKQYNSPFDSYIETSVALVGSSLALPNSLGDTWADNDRYIRPIFSRKCSSYQFSDEPYVVPFAVRIYRDRIERGSKDSGYTVAYADLYDVLEHKRFPDVAILRSKEYGETVVLKDGFGEASWDEVKTYIDRMIAEAKQTKRVARRTRLFGR